MDYKQFMSAVTNESIQAQGNLFILVCDNRARLIEHAKMVNPLATILPKLEDIYKHIGTMGLFSIRRTFILDNEKELLSMPISAIEDMARIHTVIAIFSSIDKRSKMYKEAKDYIVDIPELTATQLVVETKHIANSMHLELDDNAVNMIVDFCDGNMQMIRNEVHKLAHLGQTITDDIIADLIIPPLDLAIFDMLDAIATKNANDAFIIYRDIIRSGESPIKIVSMLYGKFKQVFLVQSLQNLDDKTISSKVGMSAWQVKNTRKICNAFNELTIIDLMRAIFVAEYKMKTGKVEPGYGMEDLMLVLLKAN